MKKTNAKLATQTSDKQNAKAAPAAETIRPRTMDMTEEQFRDRFNSDIEAQAESLVDGYTNDNEELSLALDSAYDSISYLRQDSIRIVDSITPLQWKPLAKAEAIRLSGLAADGISLQDIEIAADSPDDYTVADGQSVWTFTLKRGKDSCWIWDESFEETIARCGKKNGPYAAKALQVVPSGFVRYYEEHGIFVINLEEKEAKKYLLACGFSASNLS